jgi:hypothetical protein
MYFFTYILLTPEYASKYDGSCFENKCVLYSKETFIEEDYCNFNYRLNTSILNYGGPAFLNNIVFSSSCNSSFEPLINCVVNVTDGIAVLTEKFDIEKCKIEKETRNMALIIFSIIIIAIMITGAFILLISITNCRKYNDEIFILEFIIDEEFDTARKNPETFVKELERIEYEKAIVDLKRYKKKIEFIQNEPENSPYKNHTQMTLLLIGYAKEKIRKYESREVQNAEIINVDDDSKN